MSFLRSLRITKMSMLTATMEHASTARAMKRCTAMFSRSSGTSQPTPIIARPPSSSTHQTLRHFLISGEVGRPDQSLVGFFFLGFDELEETSTLPCLRMGFALAALLRVEPTLAPLR